MSTCTTMTPEMIRLLFELERDDNPCFYDELIRFKKDTKRVNRLRTLAQEGLLAQHWPCSTVETAEARRAGAMAFDQGGAVMIKQIFEQPIAE